jgi:GR25 family glycosyltransferase involved in LPS biosynthesis
MPVKSVKEIESEIREIYSEVDNFIYQAFPNSACISVLTALLSLALELIKSIKKNTRDEREIFLLEKILQRFKEEILKLYL